MRPIGYKDGFTQLKCKAKPQFHVAAAAATATAMQSAVPTEIGDHVPIRN